MAPGRERWTRLVRGQIGKLRISRLICGSNLINGFAHARGEEGPYDLPRHDNMRCVEPERTSEFMKTCTKPWIAYKVLAAGAIHPRDGFRYAFENGADFACVGMLDFQVGEDAVIANTLLKDLQRPRPWRA